MHQSTKVPSLEVIRQDARVNATLIVQPTAVILTARSRLFHAEMKTLGRIAGVVTDRGER